MRKTTVMCMAALLCLTLVSFAVAADDYAKGKVIQSATMPSKILGHDVRYTVYLPPDYDTSTRDYPVFYLLHGGGDDDTCWVHFGEIQHVMDKGIAEGRITPMIVVTPDARRKGEVRPSTYFMNDFDGGYRWSDMFHEEFIPFFEKEYRVRKWMEIRGIGGLSMGGFGALSHAFRYPDKFSVVVGLSAALHTKEDIVGFDQAGYDRRYGATMGTKGKTGDERFTDHYRANHPLELMRTIKLEDLKKQRIFLDCGAQDYLEAGNFEMHRFLRKHNIDHFFRLRTGAHVWQFWREGIVPGMEFASSVFHH